MLLKDRFYALSEVIDHVKVFAEQDDVFCLYGQGRECLGLKVQYFVADYPSVEGNKEIYPESVKNAGLSYLYSE